jgi:hypothetical protein
VVAFPRIGLEQPPKPIRWFRTDELPNKQRLAELGFERLQGTIIHVREMSTEDARELLARSGYILQGDLVTTEAPPEKVQVEMVGTVGRPEKRAATKIAINYVAATFGHTLIRTAAFDEVRNFARHDIGESRIVADMNPWTFGPPGGPRARGHYLSAQANDGWIVVQMSLFLRLRYLVPLLRIADLVTGIVELGACHFFDIDAWTVRQLSPLPLRPGRPLKIMDE